MLSNQFQAFDKSSCYDVPERFKKRMWDFGLSNWCLLNYWIKSSGHMGSGGHLDMPNFELD